VVNNYYKIAWAAAALSGCWFATVVPGSLGEDPVLYFSTFAGIGLLIWFAVTRLGENTHKVRRYEDKIFQGAFWMYAVMSMALQNEVLLLFLGLVWLIIVPSLTNSRRGHRGGGFKPSHHQSHQPKKHSSKEKAQFSDEETEELRKILNRS
jgi:hypothetical protein